MIAFRNWPDEFLSIASPCFHAVSFVSKFIYYIYVIYIAEYVVVIHCIYCFILKSKSLCFSFIYLPFVTTRCITRFHSLYHSLSFVVTRCHSLYHSLSFVVNRCTTRLSFYKRSIREIFFFFKNRKENETGRLIPDNFLLFKKALYIVKESG